MIVGEAPGYHESHKGVPFCGKSGIEVLQPILNEIGAQASELFVTNVVKHRPPKNRNPTQEEIDACWPYFQAQVELIDPKVIVCLGRVAGQTLFNKTNFMNAPMRRGQYFSDSAGRHVAVTWHPAYVARQTDVDQRAYKQLRADLRSALEHARGL